MCNTLCKTKQQHVPLLRVHLPIYSPPILLLEPLTSYTTSYLIPLYFSRQKHTQRYTQLSVPALNMDDDDGFTLQSSRRRGATREPARGRGRESFLQEVPRYGGTDEDYDRAHYARYGHEEGMISEGHHHGSAQFPHGSDRQRLHTHYSNSTKPRVKAGNAYRNGVQAANRELGKMSAAERDYYRRHTGGLAPHQHEQLDPRAGDFRDSSLRNAENRRAFLESHPHGYHSRQDQDKHHNYTTNAYGDYEYARDRQQHHETHRSYSKVDSRRDQWGRPVPHR